MSWERERASIRRDAGGIAAYATAFGMSYGAVSVTSGLSVAQTCVLSLVMFTGASQFAFIGVVGGGGSALAGVPAALLLALRNTFYGVRMSGILGVRGRQSLFASHLVIDETTAMTITRSDQRAQRYAFWVTGVVLFVLWNAGTLVGALGGSAIGEPEALGLDAAVPAAFLALLWPRLDDPTARVVAVGGAAVATLLVPLVPAGVPVLAAAPVAVVAGLRGRAVRETS